MWGGGGGFGGGGGGWQFFWGFFFLIFFLLFPPFAGTSGSANGSVCGVCRAERLSEAVTARSADPQYRKFAGSRPLRPSIAFTGLQDRADRNISSITLGGPMRAQFRGLSPPRTGVAILKDRIRRGEPEFADRGLRPDGSGFPHQASAA